MDMFKRLGFTVMVAALMSHEATRAVANPLDGFVSAGQASIVSSGRLTTINQNSDRAVIDWRSFDIAPDEHTDFRQRSSSSITLNRVNSNDPSRILGALTANGHVIIVNPNGVFFGKGSRVDVGGLTATSANITNRNFMAGRMKFNRPGKANAQVVNEGSISARDAGLVDLVAPDVENKGVITATLGRVNLASGNVFTLDLANDGLLRVAVDGNALPAQIVANSGRIAADGGQVNLTAAAARTVLDSLVANSGVIEAKTLGAAKGQVTLDAGSITDKSGKKRGLGTVQDNGLIDVSGLRADEKGGDVGLLGGRIALGGTARIDASGQAGGGCVKIGGDFHGAGDTPTASTLAVARGATINADALRSGDAGNVTLWADGSTYFSGTISARGGQLAGNGGFVEVSGKDFLSYHGDVTTLAAHGDTGTLLLDPANIVIANGTGDGASDGTGTFQGNATPGTVAGADSGPSTIYESELEGISAATNISVAATNGITINSLSDGVLNLAQTAGKSVTFSAGAGGFTMANAANTIQTAGGAVTITSTGAAQIGNITTNGGAFNVTSTGATTANTLSTAGGLITVNVGAASTISGSISGSGTALTKSSGTGSLSLLGTNSYTGGTTLGAGTLIFASPSAFGTGTLILNGGILQGDGAARTITNAVSLNTNSTISGTSDLTFSNTLTNTSAGNPGLTISNTA